MEMIRQFFIFWRVKNEGGVDDHFCGVVSVCDVEVIDG